MENIITAGLVISIGITLFIIILMMANKGVYFTIIQQGTVVLIVVGESLRAIWPNVGELKISQESDLEGRHWLVTAKNEKDRIDSFFHGCMRGTIWFQKFLWNTTGIRFISFMWPQIKRHSFNISRKRLRESGEETPGTSLKDRIVVSNNSSEVSELLFFAPRPVFVGGIELAGDNSRVDILALCVWQLVIPSLPALYLRGDFYPLLDAAIETALVNFGAAHKVAVDKKGVFQHHTFSFTEEESQKGWEPAPLTYSHWLQIPQAGGDSPIQQTLLRSLNFSKSYYEKLKVTGKTELAGFVERLNPEIETSQVGEESKGVPSGVTPRFGFALRSFRIIGREAHGDTKELAMALLAKETNFHQAEGLRAKAQGDRDAMVSRAEGEMARIQHLTSALTKNGVSAEKAGQVVETMLRTENVRDSNIVTYVEGGSRASVLIPSTTKPTSAPKEEQEP